MFSAHAGAPTDAPLLDTDPSLYSIQKAQVETAPFDLIKTVSEEQTLITRNDDRLAGVGGSLTWYRRP